METMRASLLLLLFSLSSAVPQGGAAGQMQSDAVGNKPIQIVTLGRPFSLGMFYDSRSDSLIPGLTLWNRDTLESGMTVTPRPNTEFSIVASESISEKMSSLGVEASLKASFLGGLVSVEGSAKYLKDDKKSKKQARVTLQYKTTTVFKTLSMDQLGTGNLQHSEVIDKGLATHVVTGILYGAQAFFVFNQESSEEESVQDIQGNLKIMINKLPFVQIEGSGSLNMADSDKERVKKFSCTFHGDFRLLTSPTTFEEAVKVYQSLPGLLGPNAENAVPVVVYLLPLSALDSRASKLVRQISIRLVTEAENILEVFTEIEMWSNDVLKSPAGQNIPQMYKNIGHFKALCSEFKLGLQRSLAQKLPLIRGGGEGEAALAEVLQKVSQSPFNRDKLNQWKEDKEDQAEVFQTIMKLMKNTEFVSSENALTNKVIDSANALVFVFTFRSSAGPFLSELEQHLKNPESVRSDASQHGSGVERWFNSRAVIESVIYKAQLFGSFAEANKDSDRKRIQFLALGLTDENHEGSTNRLFVNRVRVSEDFQIPSEPQSVVINGFSHDSVTLTFSAPSGGAQSVTGYRVEFSERGREEWNHRPQAEPGTVTVSDLKPNTEYRVRVRAVTAVGVGPEAAPKTFKTLPCSPPEDLRGTATATEVSVRWRRPAQVGDGVHIHNYIVEFGQTQDNMQWSRELSPSEEKLISGLQPETSYSVRVVCDCGDHGRSQESSIITVTTPVCVKDPDKDVQAVLQTQLDSIKEQMREQASELQSVKTNVESLNRHKTDQASEVQIVKTNVESLNRHKTAERVAFSAAFLGVETEEFGVVIIESDTGPYDIDITVICRKVFSNIGNGYNSQAGVFTAPVKGLYHFEYFCHVESRTGTKGTGTKGTGTKVYLEKNGERVVTAEEHQTEGSGTTGNSVSLELEHGDRVNLKLKKGFRVYGDRDHYTSFSGHLVFLL